MKRRIKWVEKDRETIVLKDENKVISTFNLGLLGNDGGDYFDKATGTFEELIDCEALDAAYEHIFGEAIDYSGGGTGGYDQYENECYGKQKGEKNVTK